MNNIKLIACVFIFFSSIFMLTNSGGIGFSEGEYSYWVAEQILSKGRLGFSESISGVFEVAPNGVVYASHEIGNTLFMLPVAFINLILQSLLSRSLEQSNIEQVKEFILSFQPGILCAITATTFFSILRYKFSKKIASSFIATALLCFTTYFWEYTRSLYDGVLCTSLLTISFYCLLEYKQTKETTPLIISLLCLGFGFITRFPMLLLIFPSVIYAFLLTPKKNRTKLYLITLITLSPFFLWQAFYNHLRTGLFYLPAVLLPKYAGTNLGDSTDTVAFPVKFIGLLISPGKGLFVYAPLVMLSVLFFSKFYKEHRKEAIYIFSTIALWLLLHSNLGSNWYGMVGWGPRHLIVILPIAFIPFAVNIEQALKGVYIRLATIILSIFGFILSTSSIISNFQFRISYAREHNLDSDNIFVWSFRNNQAVDMIKAAIANIARIFSGAPPIDLSNMSSDANEYASSTLNIWANSLIYAGVPWYLAILLTMPLIALAIWAMLEISRMAKASLVNEPPRL